MSVAGHLNIRLDEYDSRIRTFIPDYEAMLDAAADALGALDRASPHLVDLGTGTGALAARCLRRLPSATITLVDVDPDILAMAGARVGGEASRVARVVGSFTDVALPPCDAFVGSLAFHHVRTVEEKRRFYGRCHGALRPGGMLVSADCCPPADALLAAQAYAAWRAHMSGTYAANEADGYLAAWAAEDVYFPLPAEVSMMQDVGFSTDVVWRRGMFAVIVARRP
jgi:SAM-dependent methyltransferase